jgi:gliding motility-associated-like protein
MRENNGKGAVTQKNVSLFSSSTERVIAVRGNPSDPNAAPTTWIVTHDFNTNAFRVYPLTAQGVGTPITYTIGATHGPEQPNGEGYVKASADGSQIAIVIPGADGEKNLVELFDFDPATGEITNRVTIDLGNAPPPAYGVEFFGEKLYVSLRGNGTTQSKLLQFTLTDRDSSAIAQSRIAIDSSDFVYGALQVGPDQKIYLAVEGQPSIGVINNPGGNTVAEVDFNDQGFDLEGGTSGLGLPNNGPTESRSYGQSFAFEGPPCTDGGTPVTYRFQAQPDRAGGDPAKSTYLWTFPGGRNYNMFEVQHAFPGPGTYVVNLRIFNDCIPGGEDVEPQTIVIGENPPNINLGPDQNICPSTNPVTLSAYPANVNPAVTYQWNLPGGSTSTSKTVQATVSGTYTVFAISVGGQCIKADSVNINFSAPVVNLGSDTTLCQGNTLVLNAANPGSTYAWFNVTANQALSETSQTITVNPAATTTYSVTVTDPRFPNCPVTDAISVSIGAPSTYPAPTVVNATNCTGANSTGSITLNGLNPADQVVWNNGATGGVLSNVPPGLYTATITNASGCPTTISAAINATNSTLAYTSNAPLQIACANPVVPATLQLTAAAGNTGTPTSVIWRNAAGQTVQQGNSLSFSTIVAGIYSVEIRDAAGCRFSLDNLAVTASPGRPEAPNPSVVNTSCSPNFSATLYPNYSGQVQPVTYQWTGPNVVSTNPDGTATVGSPGVYTLRVINQATPACFTEAQVSVTGPPTTPFQLQDVTACGQAGQVVEVNATTVGWDIYEWRNANNQVVSSGPRAQVPAGTYTVRVRNSRTGCEASDQVTVTFNAPPAAPTAALREICVNSPVPALTATGAAGASFVWYSNQALTIQVGTGASFTPQINTNTARELTYYVVQVVNGCPSPAASVILRINPNPPVPTISGTNVFCQGGNTVLTSSATAGNQWLLNGQPIAGQTGRTLTVTQAGNYSVRVTAATCSSTSLAFRVDQAAQPAAPVAQSPAAICVGEPVPALNAAATGNNNIRWYNNPNLTGNAVASGSSFTPTVNNQVAGTFTFYAVQGTNGCLSPATVVTITINAVPTRPTIANAAPVICSGAGIPPFTISNPAANATYIWYSNANLTTEAGRGTSFSPNLTSNALPGVYAYYVVQSVGTCRSQQAEARLTINRSPIVNLGPDRTICIDDSVTLDATNQGTDITYRWSTTQTTPTIQPTRSGTYSVTVTIGNCSVTDEVTLNVLPSVRTNVVTREVAVCTSDLQVKPVNLDAGPGDFTYFWPQLNRRERIVEVNQPGVYDVILTNSAGCSKTEKITVLDRCDARVFVPEAFTPNGEAPNDLLEIKGAYVIDSRIVIYNRWGEVVFAADNILESGSFWDGTYRGQPAQSGTYAWKITYKSRDYPDREPTVMRGGVLLIR